MTIGANGDGDSCEIITHYTYHTQVYLSSYPQPTIATSTIHVALSTPTPTLTPDPPLRYDSESLDSTSQPDSNPFPHRLYRRHSDLLYPWYNVLALEHVTSHGLCPTPSPAPTPPLPPPPNSASSSTNTLSNHGAVNVHRAILAGALATCIIVLLLAISAAFSIFLWRRSRRRASEANEPLHDLDDTCTTLSSVPSERGRDRLEHFSPRQPNWILTPTIQAHLPNRLSSSRTPFEPIETLLTVPRTSSFISGWQMDANALRTGPPSIALSEDSHAPSFFPGDEASFLSLGGLARVRHIPSASALSCAATIASDSAISATPLPTLTHSSSTTTSQSLGPAMASLIDHKTFILTMIAARRQAQQLNPIDHHSPLSYHHQDDQSACQRSGICESIESEMAQSTESTYWKTRR